MSITFKNVNYSFNAGTSISTTGLKNININLSDNHFYAVVGQTGSGKSTFMQQINGLLKPTSGTITVGESVIKHSTKEKELHDLRGKVSLVFQFPEDQLFEETVLDDVAFGPKNYRKEAPEDLAMKWLKRVGLEEYAEHSPFELSGGQMRLVAIAGILAIEPDVLLLDEPAAGLDPAARHKMMQLFKAYQASGHTVIMVTHNLDEVAEYADQVIVFDQGELIKNCTPKEFFSDYNWLKKHHLGFSHVADFSEKLGFLDNPLTMDELVDQVIKAGDQDDE
ncbi:MAG: energy-coupling factor transporter ATPase [Lactobacillus sp.]|nr:energy-coupling factor transporter ATPase [Lactobacillus sp.]